MLFKKLKEKQKKDIKIKKNKNVTDIMNIKDIDKDGAIELKNGYLNIFQIKTKDIYSFSDQDEIDHIIAFSSLLKTIDIDLKILSLNFPVNAVSQKYFLKNKYSKAKDETIKRFLKIRYNELDVVESNRTNIEFYLFVFTKNKDMEREQTENVIRTSNKLLEITSVDFEKKKKILFKINNLNTKLFDLNEKALLANIQPIGGVAFKDKYIEKGDGYESCIYVYKYPNQANKFWLKDIMNKENAIVTIDISNYSFFKMKRNLNKSLAEQQDRINSERTHISRINAEINYRNLNELAENIEVHGEKMKEIHTRIFLYAKTKEDLEREEKKVLTSLETSNFRGNINLCEQRFDWQSLTSSTTEQKKFMNARSAKLIPSSSLAGGFPFYHTSLEDKTGLFLGTTKTYGSVLFDIFTKTDIRNFYNAVAIGTMGTGKSTLLKKILLNNTIVGNSTRIIDVTGEFRTLVEGLGGKVITLDGTGGVINPLEIMATIIDDKTNEVLDDKSYSMHMSKMSMIYSFLSPSSSDNEQREFSRLLRNFYKNFGIDIKKCTRYKKEEYPIMEDFLNFLYRECYIDPKEKKINENLSSETLERIESIILTIENLVEEFGSLFNQQSSVDSIKDESIVSFEIKNLTQMDRRIFNVQMFNILTLNWNNALLQGSKEKEKFESKEKEFNDIKRSLLLIDEAHRIININNMMGVEYLTNAMREFRKYFGGVFFATQSIRDVASNDITSIEFEKIKTLFELTQYKFIMKQDNASLSVLEAVFQGLISSSELLKIPNLKTGETILAINGLSNIEFEIYASDEELDMFKGGL